MEGILVTVCAIGMFIITIAALISAATSDTALPKGTLEITQTFEGLKDGVIPTEYVLGLFTEDASKKQDFWEYELFLPEGTRYVFYNNEAGKFQLNSGCNENVQLEQLWDKNSDVCGFKWKLTDLPIGTYYVEAVPGKTFAGCIPHCIRDGLKVNGGEPQFRPEPIPTTIEGNTLTTLSLIDVYKPLRVPTRKEKAASQEQWRAHQALLSQHKENKKYAELTKHLK